MPDFLEALEVIAAQDASVERLFGGDGDSIAGHRRERQSTTGRELAYRAQLAEAVKFLAEVYSGKRRSWQLQEAMTTSDFPYLFGDILDRQLLANYRETPTTYRDWCHLSTVSDFRLVKRFAINGAESVLSVVPEQAEYPESKLSDTPYQYQVTKYGRRIPFSWEAIMNDDLMALRDIPARFGRAAGRSVEKFATSLIADANGPHASFFTVGNKNQIVVANGANSANPPLSIQGLQDAMTVLSNQRDADGEPIAVDMVYLLVPPALEVIAQNILHATEIYVGGFGQAGGGGVAAQGLRATNWMQNKVKLEVLPYLPIISTTNGNTAWYLVADPNGTRPAVEIGFLQGHTDPEVFIKEPNQRRVGSATSNAMDGDFLNDSIEYKIRYVFGGVRLDSRAAVASNGSAA